MGGLFPQFRLDSAGNYVVSSGGNRRVHAVQMAIDRVNNKKDGMYDDLLPNTQVFRSFFFFFVQILLQLWPHDDSCSVSVQLKLLVRDTKVRASSAVAEAFKLAKHDCIGFIGPGSSGPSKSVSSFLALEPIDRAVISYSATSAELSDSSFSNFLRTPPTDDVQAKLMAKLMMGL